MRAVYRHAKSACQLKMSAHFVPDLWNPSAVILTAFQYEDMGMSAAFKVAVAASSAPLWNLEFETYVRRVRLFEARPMGAEVDAGVEFMLTGVSQLLKRLITGNRNYPEM